MINTVFSGVTRRVTYGGGEGVVISPARAKSKGPDASKAVTIVTVLVSFIKILVV